MRDLYSKTNAPYLIAGAFATLVLLASGTLAVAPYVEFLSSVAAFNVALPVALSLSILSVLVLALSCKMIKKIEVEKNKFAEKEQKLANVKQQFESKVQELNNKGNQIRELKDKIGALNNKNKDLHDENTELSAKVKGQLKYKEEMLSLDIHAIIIIIGCEGIMRDLYSKTNAPYLIAGAFATLVLLASGTLAVAPYVEFLSSVAAFNVALPVALSLSILFVLVLALSCKMIKKIEVEKNKFAEKEQKLANVKQQFESKVQELNNKGNQIRELKDKIGALNNKNKDLHDENTELSAKVKGQLKYKEEMLSLEYQELHDENTKLNEKKGNLQGELCEMKNKLSNLEHEYNDLLCKLKEKVSSLNHQLTMLEKEKIQLETELRKKVEELVVQLRIKSDEASSLKEELKEREKELSNDIKELEKKLYQLEREKKRLEGEVSYERQEHTRFKNEVDKLSTKEKKHLSKIEELEKELLSLKADEEELVNQSINVKDDYKKNVNKFEEKKREYVTKTVFTVLSVVKERVEQGLFNLEEQDMQDTDRIQEAVDEFMQPIYEKLGINNQLDISSEHSSEFKGTGENKLANGLTFPKPLSPHTSTPRRYLRKSLSPKKEDEDENKENSEQLNHESLDTNINSPHSSPFKDTTHNSYHTLKM